MENISDINGKKLALLAWGKDELGEDDVAVFTGIAQLSDSEFKMIREDSEIIELPLEWLDRIQDVSPELKSTLLNSEFVISVSVGNLDENSDQEEFLSTGLKWPT